jgi:hypothetical protein
MDLAATAAGPNNKPITLMESERLFRKMCEFADVSDFSRTTMSSIMTQFNFSREGHGTVQHHMLSRPCCFVSLAVCLREGPCRVHYAVPSLRPRSHGWMTWWGVACRLALLVSQSI